MQGTKSSQELKEYEIQMGDAKEPKQNSRARSYCFTLNNYTEEEYNEVVGTLKNYQYTAIGTEVGESGTPHLQGFVYEPNKIAWNTLKRLMPRAAIFDTKAKGKKLHCACNSCK